MKEENNNKSNIKKLTLSALFVAVSLTLFVIEGMIPPIVPIPGVKIGLAYLPVSLVAFIGGRWKITDAAVILAARVLLSALIAGSPSALLFSLTGGMLAMIAMTAVKLIIKDSYAAVVSGVFSAAAHNTGQLAAASIIYTQSVWAYLPYLMAAAVVSGLFNGFVIYFLLKKPSSLICKIKNLK